MKSGREGPYFFQNDLLNDARTVSAVTHFAFEGSDCQRGVRRSFSATSERFWPDASPDAVNDSRRNRNRRGSGEGPLPYAEPRLLLPAAAVDLIDQFPWETAVLDDLGALRGSYRLIMCRKWHPFLCAPLSVCLCVCVCVVSLVGCTDRRQTSQLSATVPAV